MRGLPISTAGFLARYLTLFGGEVFSKLCVLVAFAYLARVLGPGDYGIVESALSITVFFILGVESGMGAYGARIIAADAGELPRLLPRIMLLRMFLGIPAILAIIAIVVFSRSTTAGMLAVTALAVPLTPFLTQWVFQGLRQMQWVAAGGMARNFVFVALVLFLVQPGSDIRLVAVAEVAGVCALALVNSFHLYLRLGVRPQFQGAFSGSGRLLGDVWPLGLSDFAWASLWYAPVILAGWVGEGGSTQVAWIAAPMRIVMSVHTLVWLYFFNLLPDLAEQLSLGLQPWRELMRRSMAAAMWPAGLIALGGTLVAPALIPAIFGANFTAAVRPFQIVIWMIPVAWFSGHFRFSLIAAGQQRWELVALATGAAVTVVAALILSREAGSAGAAIAFVMGGIVNAILATWFSIRRIGSPPDMRSLMPWLAALALALVLGAGVSSAFGSVAGASAGCAGYLALGARHINAVLNAVRAWRRR